MSSSFRLLTLDEEIKIKFSLFIIGKEKRKRSIYISDLSYQQVLYLDHEKSLLLVKTFFKNFFFRFFLKRKRRGGGGKRGERGKRGCKRDLPVKFDSVQ